MSLSGRGGCYGKLIAIWCHPHSFTTPPAGAARAGGADDGFAGFDGFEDDGDDVDEYDERQGWVDSQQPRQQQQQAPQPGGGQRQPDWGSLGQPSCSSDGLQNPTRDPYFGIKAT